MNYGRQASAYPQKLNQMFTNWTMFLSFDDTNRNVKGILGIYPTTLSMRDNHNNREASWISLVSGNLRFNVLKYSRSGANLVSTLRTFNVGTLPSPSTYDYIGTRKLSDAQYQMYYVETTITGATTTEFVLHRVTINLDNPTGGMPWTGTNVDEEVATLTYTGITGIVPLVQLNNKTNLSNGAGWVGFIASGKYCVIVADIESESFSVYEDVYGNPIWNQGDDDEYEIAWRQLHAFGLGQVASPGADDGLVETHYQHAQFMARWEKDHTSSFASRTYFVQVTGDHYQWRHYRWVHKVIPDEHLLDPPLVDEWYRIDISNTDEATDGYAENRVYEPFDVEQFAPLPMTIPVIINKGAVGVVIYAGDYCLYTIGGGIGAVIDPPLNCSFWVILNCIDDITGAIYALVVDSLNGTINLISINSDGDVGTNLAIDTDFRYTGEDAARNFGNFIFTFQTQAAPVNGHLIYFSTEVDGPSQVIMLPEIQ